MSDVTARYTALFDRLRDATSAHERLVVLGHGSIVSGKFVLRPDLRALLETSKKSVDYSLAAGATRIEALIRLADDAEAAGATRDGTTFVIYAAFRTDGGRRIYVGETTRTCAVRWSLHPSGCLILAKAIEKTEGGKRAWTCRPILALPEGSRSKDLLLYFEEAIQRHLETVGTPWGLNCRYGRGVWSGDDDDESWRARYEEMIGHLLKTKKWPSSKSTDPVVRFIGNWACVQRQNRESLSTHRVKALEALRRWTWSVVAPSVTTTGKIDRLLVDPVVAGSNGWEIPKWAGAWATKIRRSFAGIRGCHKMTPEDKVRIERFLPCLTMEAIEARFRYKATTFAALYLDAATGVITYPTVGEDYEKYMWIHNIRAGMTTLGPERIEFLESIGLEHIATSRKVESVRKANFSNNKHRNRSRCTVLRENTKRARLVDEQDMLDSITAGPLSP